MRFTALLFCATLVSTAAAQGAPAAASPTVPPPPATKLEAFRPSAGTLTTLGFDDIRVPGLYPWVTVDAREMRGPTGATVRGAVIEVSESQYRSERAMVDADEVDELLKAIASLQAVQSNPTPFKNFEVRYTTRGELRVVAFNASDGKMRFAIEAGRVTKASRRVDAGGLEGFRVALQQAATKLASLPAK